MGIPGLWPFINRSRKLRTLEEVSLEYFRDNRSGFRALRLGIDASMVMAMATIHVNPRLPGERYENLTKPLAIEVLCLLHDFLLSLLAIPTMLPIFIFDGPKRPLKRGAFYPAYPFGIERDFRRLLEVYGVPARIAPGEAEYEIVAMEKGKWLDAVWTGDGDVFLAAPSLIIRLPLKFETFLSTPLSKLKVEAYTYSSLPLSRADFTFLALVVGGDYHDGIIDWSQLPAQETRKRVPPRELLKGIVDLGRQSYLTSTDPDATFATAVLATPLSANWVTQLSSKLTTVPFQKLPVVPIPHTWPSPRVLSLYLSPLVSTADEFNANPPRFLAPSLSAICGALVEVLRWEVDDLVDQGRMEKVWRRLASRWLWRTMMRRDKGGWGGMIEPEVEGGERVLITAVKRGLGRAKLDVEVGSWREYVWQWLRATGKMDELDVIVSDQEGEGTKVKLRVVEEVGRAACRKSMWKDAAS